MRKLIAAAAVCLLLIGCIPPADVGTPSTTLAESTTTTETTTTTTSTTTSTTTTTVLDASGIFEITDGRIIDPDGEVFYPVGANIAVKQGIFETGYTFNVHGTGTGRSQQVQQWGWNIVRATLICVPPSDGPSLNQVNTGLDNFIAEYTAKKIVVMVECHDLTGRDPSPQAAEALTNFMVGVAKRHRDNPYVWLNPYNEPFATNNVTGWLALQENALSRIREVSPTGVFVADLLGYGQGVVALMSDPKVSALATQNSNVLISWHAWGAVGSANDANLNISKARHKEIFEWIKANKVPVIIGEFGDPLTLDEGTAGPPIWNRNGAYAVMELAPQYGIGLIWWHATGDSGIWLTYSLMANRTPLWGALPDGTGLSAAGQVFWNITH